MKLTLAALFIALGCSLGCCAQTQTVSQYLDKQIVDTSVQLAVALQTYAPTHPAVRSLRTHLESLRSRRAGMEGQPDDAQILARQLDVDIVASETRLTDLRALYSATHPKIRAAEAELQELKTLRAAVPKQ